MAAGQTTRPAGADTAQRAPSNTATAPTTGPASIGQLQPQQPKAAEGSSLEAQPIRRDTSAPDAGSGGGSGAARRDGSGKPVVPPPASSFDLRRVGLALGAVVGLIFLLHWLAKRLFPGVAAARSSQAVRVLSRSVLAPKQQVLLVQVGRRVIVVGDSGAQMNALAQIDDPDEIAALVGQLEREKRPSASAFGGFFRRAQHDFDAPDDKQGQADEPESQDEQPPAELGLSTARGELKGLMDRVQELSQQFRKS